MTSSDLRRTALRTVVAALAGFAVAASLGLPAAAASGAEPAAAGATVAASTASAAAPAEPAVAASRPVPSVPSAYTNPVTDSFSDSFADPSIIRGRDGWFYLYATSDPLVSGGEPQLMGISRTRDFVAWEYLGPVFDASNLPSWAASDSYFWAPDIRRIGDEYLLYFTVTDTARKPGPDAAIGLATAPTPAGPWVSTDAPVIDSELLPDQPADGTPAYYGTIDPAQFTDDDGRIYLYFGGFAGGPRVVELDPTGHRAITDPVRVASPDRYEGSYVVKHDGLYYLMLSSAGCCAGPTSGYSVFTGRSDSPLGPFVDARGVSLNDSRSGGDQTLVQNGNRWVGVGHHAVITDLAGQDYIVYHGIDRDDPWLDEPGGINRRPTLIDRLDWIDGWPVARSGAGPSDDPQPAPVAASALGIDISAPAGNGALRSTANSWTPGTDAVADGGAIAQLRPTRRADEVATVRDRVTGDQRVELDLRLAGDGTGRACVDLTGVRASTVCLDGAARELTIVQGTGRQASSAVAHVPDRIDLTAWHSLSIDIASGALAAELSESRLSDPVAAVSVDRGRPGRVSGVLSLEASGGGADVDNLSVTPLAVPVTTRIADPAAGAELYREDFSAPLDASWQQLRVDGDVTVADGALEFTLTDADLSAPDGQAPLVLRTPPSGDWIAQTRFTFDVGVDTVRNYQQAGMIVYEGDDDFLRLGSVALGQSRLVEFTKEQTAGERVDRGSHLGGPTAATMWLRILHTTSADGEELYRSASSIDGTTWRWGATWTLPAGSTPRIGLYAGGGAEPAAVARFDDFRLFAVG